MKANGYYEAFNGTRVAREDFKAVYIAGGSEPLTWDFSNLDESNLELKDPDGDGIYEISIVLNPFDQEAEKKSTWILSENLLSKPRYQSDQRIVDALFNLSLEEALGNIEPDSTLRTGAKWGGVWTRDVSYSTLLAFGYLEPDIARISLMKKVKRDRIIQDTGSGGAWPISSDRTTWSLAAWEIFKVTGDMDWLRDSYRIIKNTLEDDYKTLYSDSTGMFRGESSFLDWREQTYPKWMSNADIHVSENLGTNAVHYQAHMIAADMARLLGEPFDIYLDHAKKIREGINTTLWMEDKGYYGQYLYGRTFMNLSPRFEALGEALTILFDIADPEQAKSIISRSPLTSFGTSCIYPQIPGIPPYHNNAIWPFVQSFWNLAAGKAGNEAALEHGLASIYRAGGLFLTNYENFVAETGDYAGTEINSNRMLWSIAGNLAMVHRLFIGLSFEADGIRFQPVIPEVYTGTKILSNFQYRNAVLEIKVIGHGNEIAEITLDGKALENAFLPGSVSGKHKIEIVMLNNDFTEKSIHLVPNRSSLPDPNVQLSNSKIVWNKIPGAVFYKIYRNGNLISTVRDNAVEVTEDTFGEYKVIALDSEGLESFSSEPVCVFPESGQMLLEMETFLPRSNRPCTNYSGAGFAEISTTRNREIEIPVTVGSEGVYRIDLRYSNGTGPWNTDNNCAVRSFYVNNLYKGVLVFPQRGTNEWSDWGFSNGVIVSLKKGINKLRIEFNDWNTNMDGEINDAMLDYLRITRIL
ncbi:MAG: glycogen debranching protein [Bacteroidota bacterium]